MLSPSPSKKKPEPPVSPITELSQCLHHLEEKIGEARKVYVESLRKPYQSTASTSTTPGGLTRLFRRAAGNTPSKDETTPTKTPPTPPRSPTRLKQFEPEARFLDIPDSDTFVENLRRVAELVVVGENYVTSLQRKEEKAFARQQEKWKAQRDMVDEVSESETTEMPEGEKGADDHKEEYMQIFELFFERNALEMIINLLTGVTFRLTEEERQELKDLRDASKEGKAEETKEGGTSTPEKSKVPIDSSRRLPPFAVATQALQSVSILIQNVSRATSLYVILSSNRINELINLPLDFYLAAERHRQLEAGREALPMTFASPEISELTTHFVTFLKSLALRMNAQTLQFFLEYPDEPNADGPSSPAHLSKSEEGGIPLETSSDEEDDEISNIDSLRVDFPLYSRALEFCSAHQDSFVRLTAMNICLNTLRLTTVLPTEELLDGEVGVDSFSLGSSPGGVLYNAKPLPFRERLAIAQYTCIPSRVERLISPVFTKLAERWNSMDEKIREIDSNKDLTPGDMGGDSIGSRNEKMAKAKEKVRRERLLRVFKERAADLQDELLILEDVFKVGLIVLNEQVIEMMFATFVYPLMLQPLLLYYQRLVPLLEKPSLSFSAEHPFGGVSGDFNAAERSLAQVAGPAKTALFALGSVFHFLSNLPLLRLLFTALFHPLSPDSSGVPTLRSSLEVATVSRSGRKSIRLDRLIRTGLGDRSTYAFGTTPENRRVSKAKVELAAAEEGGASCVFVLSPALAEVLEFRGQDIALIARTRPNAYRRAVVGCLNLPDAFSDVRDLAVGVLDAAVTVLDGKLVADVLYGIDLSTFADDMPADERNLDSAHAHFDDDRDIGGSGFYQSRTTLGTRRGGPVGTDYTHEVVPGLSRCIITAERYPLRSSEWKLLFNDVAAHALLSCIRYHEKGMSLAAKTTDTLWRQTATFVATVAASIQSPMGGSSIRMVGVPHVNDPNYDTYIEGAHANYIFFDVMDEGRTLPALDELVQLAKGATDDNFKAYLVPVSLQSAFDYLCNCIGRFLLAGVDVDAIALNDNQEIVAARADASGLLRMDSLVNLLKDMDATRGSALRSSTPAGRVLNSDGSTVDTSDSCVDNISRQLYAPLHHSTSQKLFEECSSGELPATWSVIDLSGKPLLPCVCEAPASLARLFARTDAAVVAEGVTWQSLYLVLDASALIVAHPGSERSGSSHGRVITACYMERLTVQTDPLQTDHGPPARRLLLTHRWFDRHPPTMFLFDDLPEHEAIGPFLRMKPFLSTLDVWFENQTAADRAFQILAGQIFAAKAQRGLRIQTFLAPQRNVSSTNSFY